MRAAGHRLFLRRGPQVHHNAAVGRPNGARGELLRRYGQVIVGEYHLVSGDSFDAVLKAVNARYVLGLTATPVRRDSQQPVMFMLCEPMRHVARHRPTRRSCFRFSRKGSPLRWGRGRRADPGGVCPSGAGRVTHGHDRRCNLRARQGRNVLVLTERTDHLESLHQALEDAVHPLFVLHGCMARKAREAQLTALGALADDVPRVVLATGGARVSTIRRRTRLCWLCRSRGRELYSSMPGAASRAWPSPAYGCGILSMRDIRRCDACGRSASVATGQWDTVCTHAGKRSSWCLAEIRRAFN